MTRPVGNDSTGGTLDGHGTSPYGASSSDASTVAAPPVTSTAATPWWFASISVVVAVWWSDLLTEPDGTIARGRVVLAVVLVGAVLAGISCRVFGRRRSMALVIVVLSCLACWRGIVEWSVASREVSGRLDRVVRVVDDPQWRGRAVSVVVDDGRDRLVIFAYGSPGRRLSSVSSGQLVHVIGTRSSIDEPDRRRFLLRHLTGRLDVERVDVRPVGVDRTGRGFDRVANRVRESLFRGARVLSEGDRALLLGLLVGDDRFQERDTIADFRNSGLAHLTAVSGQNVAFVLAVVSPLLSRLARGPRVVATLGVLAWFAVLTRAEPSVVRAVLMAGVATVSSSFEWRRQGLDVLALAIVVGVIVDPFLVWSIGWWLSIGGCLGLAVLAPRVVHALGGGRAARVVAPTLGAQFGVLPVSLLIFGWPNAWSVPCNLLAGPIAGATMLLGLPVTLVAAYVPDVWASVLMAPLATMVRWVDVVARFGSDARPSRWIDAAVTITLPVVLIGLLRRHSRVASSRHERSPRPRLR